MILERSIALSESEAFAQFGPALLPYTPPPPSPPQRHMTHPAEWPAGTRHPAGLGWSTVLPDLDFETYSEAGYYFDPVKRKWHGPTGAPKGKKGLFVIGAAVYAEHASTEVLCLAYNLKDGRGIRRWKPGQPLPYDLIEHVRHGGMLEAWNSAFEWWIWNLVCVRRYGFPELPYPQLRCAMAKARASGYPGALGMAGSVMNLQVQKDAKGGSLLDKFSVPRTPTKADPSLRHHPDQFPVEGEQLADYNVIDIVSESEASAHVPDLEGEELQFWLADQLINRRGVAIDVGPLGDCVAIVQQCLAKFDAELCALTSGAVSRASELKKLKEWLAASCGIHMRDGKGGMNEEAFDEKIEEVTKAITYYRQSPGYLPLVMQLTTGLRALELRQLVGSASVKKVFSMTNQVSSRGRLHDLYNYHGARTGRPTGEGPQPTNLPKAGPSVYQCMCGKYHGTHAKSCPWCGLPVLGGKRKQAAWGPEAVEDALAIIKSRSLEAVRYFFGDALLTVSGCLRGLFVAAEGHDLVCSDFSSIEGVVTACLAGEDWRVEMFATHGKAYELSVSKITGIPFAEIMAAAGYDDVESPEWWTKRARKGDHHPMRQTIGKVAELASGFGGWINAWKRFGADAFMNDDQIKEAILAWRAASPNIVEFWGGQERREGWRKTPELFGLEGMAIAAILSPGTSYPVLRKDGTHTGITYLMHGDALYCTLPSGRHLTYHRPRLIPNTRPHGGQYSISFEGYNTNPQQGPTGWVTMYTYGGKLCENVVQATARDIQRAAIIGAESEGYHVVLHVYDEIVAEVPQAFGNVEGLETCMGRMPRWAVYRGKAWPIKAHGGWRGRRYRKA